MKRDNSPWEQLPVGGFGGSLLPLRGRLRRTSHCIEQLVQAPPSQGATLAILNANFFGQLLPFLGADAFVSGHVVATPVLFVSDKYDGG